MLVTFWQSHFHLNLSMLVIFLSWFIKLLCCGICFHYPEANTYFIWSIANTYSIIMCCVYNIAFWLRSNCSISSLLSLLAGKWLQCWVRDMLRKDCSTSLSTFLLLYRKILLFAWVYTVIPFLYMSYKIETNKNWTISDRPLMNALMLMLFTENTLHYGI